MSNDVELLFCIHAIPGELLACFEELVELDSGWPDPVQRAPILERLQALARPELVAARLRWTPHYDAGLRAIVERGEGLLAPPAWDYGTCIASDNRDVAEVRGAFERHARVVAALTEAEQRGARTLADAYELTSIASSAADSWFGLAPDPDDLALRARRACIAYLELEVPTPLERALIAAAAAEDRERVIELRRDWCIDPTKGAYFRRMVMWALVADDPQHMWRQLRDVPLDVFRLLGNPFLPSEKPTSMSRATPR